jgi:hypothetical protein
VGAAWGAVGPLGGMLVRRGVPVSKQFAYQVNDSRTLPGGTNVALNSDAMRLAVRLIGYWRYLTDAPDLMALRFAGLPDFSASLGALPMFRGRFSTRSPTPSGQVDIRRFSTASLAPLENRMKTFLDDNNVHRFNEVFHPGIMSHHLFVAELIHEVLD